MSVTPQSGKTVSVTSNYAENQGPTPKNEFKVPMDHKNYFLSPTDAMVSPCTQKLMQSRRLPRKQASNGIQRPRYIQTYKSSTKTSSSLADKENEHMAPPIASAQHKMPTEVSSGTDL